MPASARSRIFSFGMFSVDLQARELRKAGVRLKLGGQPFEVLCVLLERSPDVVSREDLQRNIWPENTFVDYDLALRKAITRLRETLGDSAENPRFIETLPRRGYRFIAPVTINGNGASAPEDSSLIEPSGVLVAENHSSIRNRASLWIIVALVIAMGVGAVVGVAWSRGNKTEIPQLVERQITSKPPQQAVISQSISPDGKYLAYADSSGLHLQVIDTKDEYDLPLPDKGERVRLSWLADGLALLVNPTRMIAGAIDGTLWKIPIVGGTSTKIREHAARASVSPDGSLVAFNSNNDHEIWVMNVQGDGARLLFSESSDLIQQPQWSPDGRYLSYFRIAATTNQASIETRRVSDGSTSIIVSDTRLVPWALCWLKDWRLVFELNTQPGNNNEANLWIVPIDPHSGKGHANGAQISHWKDHYAALLNATADGKTISTLRAGNQHDVYVGDLLSHGESLDHVRRFTMEDQVNGPDTWTLDGQSILFESNRDGSFKVYRQDIEKEKADRILGSSDAEAYRAKVTPDRAWILYLSRQKSPLGEPLRLMRSPFAGGNSDVVVATVPDQLYADKYFDCPTKLASCVLSEQSNGELVFYRLDPVNGKGEEVARTNVNPQRNYGWSLSPDGSRVVVVNAAIGPLARVINLQRREVRDVSVPSDWNLDSVAWSSDGKGIFATGSSPNAFLLGHVELTGQAQVLRREPITGMMSGIAPSPDGRHLAYGYQAFDSNVWLLQKF